MSLLHNSPNTISIAALSSSNDGLLRVGVQMPDAINEANSSEDVSLSSRRSPSELSDDGSFDPAAPEKPRHPHHLKLLALSAELMRPPKNWEGRESSVVSVGFVEEARKRRKGRKERCVHWDRVEISGKEFPLQRADTSFVAPAREVGLSSGATRDVSNNHQGVAGNSNAQGGIPDPSDPSYLLVGHSVCDMCLMTFETSSISGVITMRRVLEARRDWGITSAEGKKTAAASSLYGPARLCALCSQFFCAETDGIVPRGVGRSRERVSLSLESMASNKPLPSATAAPSAVPSGQRWNKKSGAKIPTRRALSGGDGDSGSPTATNFRLDQLIADDRFVVKETDLARQSGAVATQSSTADGMGADVCLRITSTGYQNMHHSDGAQGKQQRSPPPRHRCGGVETGGKMELAADGSAAPNALAPTAASSGTDDSHRTATRTATLSNGDGPEEQATSTLMSGEIQACAPSMPMSLAAAAAAALAAARTCSRTRREEQPWWEVSRQPTCIIFCMAALCMVGA